MFRATITRLVKDVKIEDEDEPQVQVELYPSGDELPGVHRVALHTASKWWNGFAWH